MGMYTSITTIVTSFFLSLLSRLDTYIRSLSISLSLSSQISTTSQLSKYTFWSPFSARVYKLPAYLTSGTRRESVAVTALGLNGTSAPGGAINGAEIPGLDPEKPRLGPTSPRLIQSNLSLFSCPFSHSPSPLSKSVCIWRKKGTFQTGWKNADWCVLPPLSGFSLFPPSHL